MLDYKLIGTGEKMMVIETGIGNSYYDWYPLIDKIKETYTVVVYHRMGYGQSDAPKSERTTEHIAMELNELVEHLKLEPFILVGHSFGGLCVQHYAMMYPEHIKGVMLVDSASSHLHELESLDTPFMNEHISIKQLVEMSLTSASKTEAELLDRSMTSIETHASYLDDDALTGYKSFVSSPLMNKTVADEFSNWLIDGEAINQLNQFPKVSLKVVCRDIQISVDNWTKGGVPRKEAECHDAHWRELQKRLCTLSDQSELVIAYDCDHMIHIENPDLLIKTLKSFD